MCIYVCIYIYYTLSHYSYVYLITIIAIVIIIVVTCVHLFIIHYCIYICVHTNENDRLGAKICIQDELRTCSCPPRRSIGSSWAMILTIRRQDSLRQYEIMQICLGCVYMHIYNMLCRYTVDIYIYTLYMICTHIFLHACLYIHTYTEIHIVRRPIHILMPIYMHTSVRTCLESGQLGSRYYQILRYWTLRDRPRTVVIGYSHAWSAIKRSPGQSLWTTTMMG